MPDQEGGLSSSSEAEGPSTLGRAGKEKKRPIPLPRSKLNVDCNASVRSDSSTSSSKRSFRKRIKSASENINGVLEGTKQVRSRLKRVLSRPGSEHKPSSVFHDETDRKTEPDRRQSLPPDDIFYKISFASPLDIGTQIKHWRGDFNDLHALDETQVRPDSETGSDVTSVAESSVFSYDYDRECVSLPPPAYPPPPAPDDISDVQSEASSYFTVGTIDTESFADDVLGTVGRMQNINLNDTNTSKCQVVSRSESWSYAGANASAYETVVLPSLPLPSQTMSLLSPSPSSSEIVSSESSSYHPTSTSIDSGNNPPSNSIDSSKYDNHRLVHHSSDTKSNHSYENWNLPCSTARQSDDQSSHSSELQLESNSRLVHSQSVIFEFDPLFDFVDNLPKPPERVDSISEAQTQGQVNDTPPVSADKPGSYERLVESPSAGMKGLVANMKQAIRNLADNSARRGSKASELLIAKDKDLTPLEKPAFNFLNTSMYNGPLFRSLGEKSNMASKYFQLAEGKLSWANDKGGALKELFTLESLMSIKRVPDLKQSSAGEDVFCFQVSVLSSKPKSFLLGATSTSERRIWMQKLLESLTQCFSTKITSNYSRAGWCFLKEGVTNEWNPAWLVLQERVLFYSLGGDNSTVQEVDLKKARCIAYREADTPRTQTSHDTTQAILVDNPDQALYLQMGSGPETQAWKHDLRGAATNSGPLLVDQQLTRDEIPTLVEKCLNFVFTHGSMSEGIYRRSGSTTNVSKLLAEFRQDAWQVQLSREQYTEHDVSTVLKRFFRDLPEPLLSTELHVHLCNAAGMECATEDKVHIYRSLLEKLHPIHYVTVRKLMGHLYFIQEKKDRNKMSVENLASIWGPTLMHVENKDSLEWSKREAEAVSDLISLYPMLFHVEEEEMAREREMMNVLERHHNSTNITPQVNNKPSGDLKVWIYIGSKDSNNCVNVDLDPNKEAGQVCKELCSRFDPPTPPHDLCLMEVVCGGDLTRSLHYKEKVLSVVVEWGYWDEMDRRDNALFLHSLAVCGDLKYADRKSKSFKSFLFEFSQSKLCYYKDKKGSIQLDEWRIEDIIWYQGFEKKRDPRTRWALTFIPRHKPQRSKEAPWFGNTIAGTSKEEQCKWMAAMLFGQYGSSDLLPKVDLM
ncbi:hypothetical protein M8J75_011445 [Diaphorina citri]|nr:hypothetical protein M8J75_011445 [Diaphorina citri]